MDVTHFIHIFAHWEHIVPSSQCCTGGKLLNFSPGRKTFLEGKNWSDRKQPYCDVSLRVHIISQTLNKGSDLSENVGIANTTCT